MVKLVGEVFLVSFGFVCSCKFCAVFFPKHCDIHDSSSRSCLSSDGTDFPPLCIFSLQTYIGTLLVSVNPYKELDIYTVTQMQLYRGVNFFELPPHL